MMIDKKMWIVLFLFSLAHLGATVQVAPPQRLVVVGDESYAPFEFLDADGKARGIIVDIWQLWSQKTGVSVEYRLMPWDTALQMAENGQADAIGGFFYSETRDQVFDYSQPYFEITTHIFFHETVFGIKGLQDLSGFRIGVVAGDFAEEYLNTNLPSGELVLYDTYDELIAAAVEGEIRVFVCDTPIALFLLAKRGYDSAFNHPQVPLYTNQLYAGVKEGNTELLQLLNQGFTSISTAEIEAIEVQWSGVSITNKLPWPWLFGGAGLLMLIGGGAFIWNNQLRHQISVATKALRESEARYRAIFDSTNDAIFVHHPETGAILDVNRKMTELYGYTRQEARALDINTLSLGEPPYSHQDALNWIKKTTTGPPPLFEWLTRDKAGQLFWVEVNMSQAVIGDQTRIIVNARDITKRKQIQAAVKESEEKLELLFSQSLDGLFFMMLDEPVRWDETVDKEQALDYVFSHQRITRVNQAMLAQYAARREQFIGLTPADFFAHDIPEGKRVWRSFFDQGRLHIDTEERRFDGTAMWIEGEYVCLYDDRGRITGHFGIQREITERKQAELEREKLIAELEAKNTELERFTYAVSHDLKSPLVTIKGFLGMLEGDVAQGDEERIREDLSYLRDAAGKMQHLLNDLLDLSRIGRLTNRPEEVELGELADEALRLVAGQIAARGVEVDIAPDLPSVIGDRPRLLEVLQNLIDNAIKFMGDQPQPRIEIGAKLTATEIICYVRDNGIGLKPSDHERIFGLFERLDQSVDGTGIGLALVKRIVELHQGRVWVESEGKGQGSTFYLSLPRAGKR